MKIDRIPLAEDRDPWDQQPHETNKQYSRFVFYRDLGRLRSLTQANKMLTALGDTIKYDPLRQISHKFQWAARVAAWDLDQDKAVQEQLRTERIDMAKRHRSVATALLAKAIKALRDLRDIEMQPADIVRFIKLATDLERLILGEPQQTVAITGPTGGPIQTEEITALPPEERKTRLAEIATELARRAGIQLDQQED